MSKVAFNERLRSLMKAKNLKTARDLAKALYESENITVTVSEYDDGTIAKSNMARRIQDHLIWESADKLQGKYVMAYCNYFGCSADYLFGRTPLKSGNTKVTDFCETTGLSEKSVKRLIEEIPDDIKEELMEFWSNVLESNIFYCLPLEYHQMCYELGQYQTALKKIGDINKAARVMSDGTSFTETWRAMMEENYLKEAEPHKGSYYMHLNEIIDNVKIYLDIWSDKFTTKRRRDVDSEFFDALERKHQKAHDEFMKKISECNDESEDD